MASVKNHDLVVIGGGPGGYVAAIRAAQLGMNVALVDKNKKIGGTCLNIGCIPSKALLESSELFHLAGSRISEHGIFIKDMSLDLKSMLQRKTSVVAKLVNGVAVLLKGNGVDVHTGFARIVPEEKPESTERRIEVSAKNQSKKILTAERVLIATGSIPVELPSLPFDFKNIVTSTEALSFDEVPKRLIVIGGGAIGLELGSVWARLGSDVTVIELMPQILPGWDGQVARRMIQILKQQGMNLNVNTRVTGFERQKTALTVHAVTAKGDEEISYKGDKILVSAGRKPFHEGVGLEENGVEWDRKSGFIQVDENYQTNMKGIYAIGDVIEGPMLAHKAEEEGIVCVERMSGIPAEVNYGVIPGVLYTAPEVASVGMTEELLKKDGRTYRRGMFSFKANGRALAMDETEGFVKVLADSDTDEVLGVHIIGPRASELIGEAVSVMEFSGSAEDIARTTHAHPTLSEATREAALAVDKRAIHSL
jgi:dihydrolipoamide dehydrogenase